jgi:hypothetical protein
MHRVVSGEAAKAFRGDKVDVRVSETAELARKDPRSAMNRGQIVRGKFNRRDQIALMRHL